MTGKGRYCLAQLTPNALVDVSVFPHCVLSTHRDLALRAIYIASEYPGIARRGRKWDVEGFFPRFDARPDQAACLNATEFSVKVEPDAAVNIVTLFPTLSFGFTGSPGITTPFSLAPTRRAAR